MSRSSNSLKATDVVATPIKLKYSASYSDTTICDTGIYAQVGINGPVTITGSVPEQTLRYWSIRHLYYSNFLTGSYQVSGSSADNFLQSTAASGTFENNTAASSSADIRSFPTASGSKIKIINIPRSSFGEQVSRKSFFLKAADGVSFNLVDDGNGNIIDTLNLNVHVGNIIYAQGFIIITNPNYYCAMDGGPTTFPRSYVFDITDLPKTFNPIVGAIPDCAPVVSSSLAFQSYPYTLFPTFSIDGSGNVTLDESDPLTNKVGTYKDFYTLQSTYCATSDEQPVTIQIIDVSVKGLTATTVIPSPSISLTPSLSVTPTVSLTPTISVTPTISTTPTQTPTPTISSTPGSSLTPTVSLTPTISTTPTISITPSITLSAVVATVYEMEHCSGTPTYGVQFTGGSPTPGKTYYTTINGILGCWACLGTYGAPAQYTGVSLGVEYNTCNDCGLATGVTFTVNDPGVYVYPVTAGNGSASGTIKNNSGVTIYVYSWFNSGGNSSGTINGDGATVAGGIALDIAGGPITANGQDFYSTNYETLTSDNTTYSWTITKNDGYSSGATMKLGYSTTIGGPITALNP